MSEQNKPTLLVMAAGMGSRYGGLKQVDPVGPHGEIIIDYSLYDAYRAGFRRVIFVIRKENEAIFREKVTDKLPADFEWHFVDQALDAIPAPYTVPAGRIKPWGTAHAVYVAKEKLCGPFVAINADDYYGMEAFEKMYAFLSKHPEDHEYAMVAYPLVHTLSDSGSVSRGICEVDAGQLKNIVEKTNIEKKGEDIVCVEGDTETALASKTPVSMNFWGFPKAFLTVVEDAVHAFFKELSQGDPLKKELYLPYLVESQIQKGAKVHVLESTEAWLGVTYREDREKVQEGFQKKVEEGLYPSPLWKKN